MSREEGVFTVGRLVSAFPPAGAHEQHVARLAEQLFRLTRRIHGLSLDYLPVLIAGAWLHDVGRTEGRRRHHVRGRQWVLERAPFPSDPVTVMVALLAGYHRKKVKPTEDPLLTQLSRERREAALKLAALLRIADGLDFTRDQRTRIVTFEETVRSTTLLATAGTENGMVNIDRATRKADLWNALHPLPLTVEDASAQSKARRRPVLMAPTDTMAEAGCRVLLHHLGKCLSYEDSSRSGEDIEAIHDMRVATRRMRAAFRVFGEYLPEGPRKRFLEDLRWLASALGAVRDRDVFLEFLTVYRETAPETDRRALNQLVGQRRRERTRCHRELVGVLDSERYRTFAAEFRAFLSRPENLPKGLDHPVPLVVEAAPQVLRARLKKVVQFRKRAPTADGVELHQLRIACKRLRYAAEFFDPCFNSAFAGLIKQCVKIQDSLGNVHDADVYSEFLREYGMHRRSATRPIEGEQEALARLEQAVASWRKENLEGFWAVWPKVGGKRKSVKKWRALLDELEARASR